MMLQEQLGKPQYANVVIFPSPLQSAVNAGLLANNLSQTPAALIASSVADVYGGESGSPLLPAFKLAVLKLQKFKLEGKEQRIATSLAALNAPQPTELSLAEWKEIVEEVEDDED